MSKDDQVRELLEKPEAQPEALKPLFKKLANARESFAGVEQAIQETRQSLNKLLEQRAMIAGSSETLVSLIQEQLPDAPNAG